MEIPTSKSANPILITAALALILSCAAGIGATNGWTPTSVAGGTARQTAGAPANGAAQARLAEKHRDATASTRPEAAPAPSRKAAPSAAWSSRHMRSRSRATVRIWA
jgi:hypothetical protein